MTFNIVFLFTMIDPAEYTTEWRLTATYPTPKDKFTWPCDMGE